MPSPADDSAAYLAEPVLRDGRLADVRLRLAGKTWHLSGRGGAEAEVRRALEHLPKDAPGDPSPPDSPVLTVFLGAGLGAGIEAVLAATGGPVAVVDKEKPVLDAAGIKRRFAAEPRVSFFAEPTAAAALARLTAWRESNGGGLPRLVAHPVYARLDPGYYQALALALDPAGPEAAGTRTGGIGKTDKTGKTGKTGRLPRVLLLTSQYFLMGEIMTACDRLGAAHKLVSVPEEEAGLDDYVRLMLAAIDALRPDFVLTTNHMGVDREGVLAGLLGRLGLPLASWFVDNPHLVLDAYDQADQSGQSGQSGRSGTVVFTWDADQVASLAAMGFAGVHYLPLAADERRFAPGPPPPPDHPFRSRVSFLGNSMAVKTGLRLEAADPPPGLRAAYRDIAAAFAADLTGPGLTVAACIGRDFPHLAAEYAMLTDTVRRLAFDTLIMWEATGQYRLDCVRRLAPFRPLIAGDPGWLRVLPGEGVSWRYHKELAYYTEAPLFYPAAEVNFNATSRQMKGAVNQRVFDVPACGAFLLTDAQAQLAELFVPGREAAVYAQPEEIESLVRHYLANPAARRAIAQAGRKRVLAEHTYAARLSRLFALMAGGG